MRFHRRQVGDLGARQVEVVDDVGDVAVFGEMAGGIAEPGAANRHPARAVDH